MNVLILGEGSELNGGRYLLECRLGAGGMATVWRAADTRLHRQVAIKLPSAALAGDDAFAQCFEREARTAAQLSHPNLVPVYDYGTEGDRPYLVSEYIDGSNLAELREQGRAPATETLGLAMLDALDHIHAAGIVHRDIKPANVLVDAKGRILLTDFGIALSAEDTSLTATGKVIGTKTYLAPEVLRGERAGPRSDLYGCGMVLAEQLETGDPDRVRRLVNALTAKDPSERPADARAALAALEQRSQVVTAPTPAQPDATEPFDPPTEPIPVASPPPPTPVPRPIEHRAPEQVLAGTERSRSMPVPPAASPARRSRAPVAIALAVAAAGAIALVVVLSGGGDQSGGGRSDSGTGSQSADSSGSSGKGGGQEAATPVADVPEEDTTESTTTEEPETAPTDAGSAGSDPERATQLSNEGYALTQQGQPEEALPLLEEAYSLFPADPEDINYGYMLFNYAQALRQTGDPAAAIPLLEERLSLFPDEQADVVQDELELAQQEAGE